MTEDKVMKNYRNAVKRRLNLPKEVKERVMSDFVCSIEARREAGMTDEAIIAELGTPKKAAEDLNEQMKEFAYRTSPWRFAFLALAVLTGGWLILYRLFLMFGMYLDTLKISFTPNQSASIGIIGGADGPTAIFVSGMTVYGSGFDWDVAIMAVLLIAGVLGFLRLRRCKQK